tara:strand:- start:208 stop:330 length:123 start_codon:yes stop_codon:yes gene_type:complete
MAQKSALALLKQEVAAATTNLLFKLINHLNIYEQFFRVNN